MPTGRSISEVLQESGGAWDGNPPAAEDEIAELRELLPFELPEVYIELLRYSDGGQGELDAAPLYFVMDSIAESVVHNEMWRAEGLYTNFWFIGGNGGLETIGFDLRSGPPWSLVTIDCIAGDKSAERVASDMADFVEKIGRRKR